ncbi:MAG: penicillin-binding protein 2 [Chloroflexi bacterium]|nr:penicillin-binding protein 2 [Chloroflexota bacterium]
MVEEKRRSYLALYISLALIFVLVAAQLYRVQILEGSNYKAVAQDNLERLLTLKPARGVIYDRNNQLLVVNNPSYSVAVTAAELPDLNCATGNLQGAKVFQDLTQLLGTRDVVAIKPKDLPAAQQGAVANILSVALQTPAAALRGPLADIMTVHVGSENLFLLRSGLSEAASKAVRAAQAQLPGVVVLNELEFNFVTRFDKCLQPVVVWGGLDYNMMQQVETKQSALAGVSIVPEPVRNYIGGALFSHLLGYVGPISREEYLASRAITSTYQYGPDDKVGQLGLEASLEDQLRGQKGAARVVVNSHEQVVSQISVQPPITGNNVTLTIDANLQKAVTVALQDGINKAKVQAGVAIVMRVDNGQVLSMVSLPSYDNNLFSTGITQANFDTLMNDPAKPMFDRAISGAYPPGSTYKMITASAALQEGVVTPISTYYCPGYIQVPYSNNEQQRTTFRDWLASGHGTINIVQALTESSDVFFYIAAGPRQEDRRIRLDNGIDQVTYTRYYTPGASKPTEFNGLGIDKLYKYATAFGLGQKTGIDLPGEVSGLAPNPAWRLSARDAAWSLGDTLFTAIGQGDNLLTPLQLVNVTAAVANGGTLYKPQLVLKVTAPEGKTVKDYQPQTLGQVPVSPENLALVREGMRQVVANKVKGTATRITLQSIPIAGKTGTAEFGDPIAIKNGKEVRRAHAWFTAFAPYDKPEIAVVVLLEGGQESLEGSTFAVPVTDAIMKAYFRVDK